MIYIVFIYQVIEEKCILKIFYIDIIYFILYLIWMNNYTKFYIVLSIFKTFFVSFKTFFVKFPMRFDHIHPFFPNSLKIYSLPSPTKFVAFLI